MGDALLLHPITHEVYRVPEEAICHDYNRPVWMRSDVFKDLSSVGSMSAEKFLRAEEPDKPDDAQERDDGAVTLGGGFVSGGILVPLRYTSLRA